MERCVDCYTSTCNCSHPEDLLGSPYHCQKRKRTRRFASPNSPLNQEDLDQLQACIESANDLLRSLGSERDEDNTRQIQLHFLEMRGEIVTANVYEPGSHTISANVYCEGKKTRADESSNNDKIEKNTDRTISLTGKIANAGKDFLQINQHGSSIFILYKNLLSIKREDSKNECDGVPEFIHANQQLRRKLVFNFGELVSKNPNFINVFFGSPLFLMLKQFIGKDIKIVTTEGMYTGILTRVDKENITMLNKKRELRFRIEVISYLNMFNLK